MENYFQPLTKELENKSPVVEFPLIEPALSTHSLAFTHSEKTSFIDSRTEPNRMKKTGTSRNIPIIHCQALETDTRSAKIIMWLSSHQWAKANWWTGWKLSQRLLQWLPCSVNCESVNTHCGWMVHLSIEVMSHVNMRMLVLLSDKHQVEGVITPN